MLQNLKQNELPQRGSVHSPDPHKILLFNLPQKCCSSAKFRHFTKQRVTSHLEVDQSPKHTPKKFVEVIPNTVSQNFALKESNTSKQPIGVLQPPNFGL